MCNLKIITLSEQFQAPDFQGNITSTIRIRVSLVTVPLFQLLPNHTAFTGDTFVQNILVRVINTKRPN